MAAASGFVCEACTVQAELGCKLRCTIPDVHLLQLERMRIIDCAHAWAPTLEPLQLKAPPCNPSIPLVWAMQDYALTLPSPAAGKQHLQFNTIHGLRSAAAYYYESLITL
eukprot:12501968-Ditylum_brightwellii.AAC.2